MITTTFFPGKYVQGAGALERLPTVLGELGVERAVVVCGGGVSQEIATGVVARLPGFEAFPVVVCTGLCTDAEIARVGAAVRETGAQAVVGVGGGTVMDVAKGTAHAMGARMVMCPTIASTDAPCSALSIVYTEAGAVARVLRLGRNPDAVVVDTAVVARAPARMLVAGMGDALATWFEAASCQQKGAPSCAAPDPASLAAMALARLCYDTLRAYGPLALAANRAHVVVPALEHVVEANTLLSGVGFESGGLAAAHSIHDGLTVLEQTRPYLHGEKVAFGLLASLFLTDKDAATVDSVYAFCESVGLPTTLAGIGLGTASDADLRRAAARACEADMRIHNEPHFVSPDAVFQCLRMADAYGHSRSSSSSSSSVQQQH